jgi:bla regulator protein blaR1
VIAWLVETAVAVTLLVAMVLALRGPVARHFGAGWAYALWIVPALRLFLPPLPRMASDLPLPTVASLIPAASDMTASLPAEAGPGQWVPFLLALWAGGAVIFLTLQWLSYRAFLARLDGSSRPARPPIFGGIRTWISEAVSGPLALGILNRRIVVPADFARRYSPVERRLALQHELVHHRRGDIWWNMAAILFLALFWWNPLAWIAFRAFRTDQELACDAAVARAASAEERHEYARALVKSASNPGLIAACALKPADELKRRLRMIRSHRSSPARSAGGVTALALFATAGFAVGSACEPRLEMPAFVQAAPVAVPAAASAPAATAPLALAAVAPTEIVVTGRAPKLEASKPSLAPRPQPLQTAEASPSELRRVLARLPRVRVGPMPRPSPDADMRLAFATTRVLVRTAEGQVYRVDSKKIGEADLARLAEMVGPDRADELRAVIEQAVARAAAEHKLRKAAGHAPSGGSSDAFELNIQTFHQGDPKP